PVGALCRNLVRFYSNSLTVCARRVNRRTKRETLLGGTGRPPRRRWLGVISHGRGITSQGGRSDRALCQRGSFSMSSAVARGRGPLQTRVTPAGEIVAVTARGTLMGNRGCLHRPDRTLGTARWRSRLWICCVLDWRGRKRDPMPPGRWTALFFLDE